jgi:hypothetical protein
MIHPCVFADQIEEEVTLYPNPLQSKAPAKTPLISPEGLRKKESVAYIVIQNGNLRGTTMRVNTTHQGTKASSPGLKRKESTTAF